MKMAAITPLMIMPMALAACTASQKAGPAPNPPAPHPMELSAAPLAYAAIGETVYVDGPRVTPLKILEDSRCPADVQCVWAGRVRIKVRIHLGSGDEVREMTMGQPIQVADGMLLLMQVLPERVSPTASTPEAEYRFGFRFAGGL